jgi:hypothetical protein
MRVLATGLIGGEPYQVGVRKQGRRIKLSHAYAQFLQGQEPCLVHVKKTLSEADVFPGASFVMLAT